MSDTNNEITREQLENLFESSAANTDWDPNGEMLWGYFFTDPSEEKLAATVPELEGKGFTIVDLFEAMDDDGPAGFFFLHVERVEAHSVDSLLALNSELYAFAAEHGLESYDGMDLGPVQETR